MLLLSGAIAGAVAKLFRDTSCSQPRYASAEIVPTRNVFCILLDIYHSLQLLEDRCHLTFYHDASCKEKTAEIAVGAQLTVL